MPMPAHQDGRDASWQFPRENALVAPGNGYPGPASPSRSRMTIATGRASGAADRSSRPESVRYMSVTIVVRRRLLTDDDTR
jgi:hypothetical protein